MRITETAERLTELLKELDPYAESEINLEEITNGLRYNPLGAVETLIDIVEGLL